ncbi:MAG: nuclear transport factor 2 family protein [Proteobacteria bacterium]|nr:nuclear transport factor 2 family protein [Pseudomonadota bacterium]
MAKHKQVHDKHDTAQHLIELERKFWQSMVREDTDAALSMLDQQALMVSSHGSMKFDHMQYRQMAQHGPMVLKDFKLGDIDVLQPTDDMAVLTYRVKQSVAPRGSEGMGTMQEMVDSSTWVRKDDQWQCVAHTETPLDAAPHQRH